ncbi:hypothetical protein ASC87_21450 [Rhizobacter sp. Root1221]|nr:hypothetical protein ASC87_21450 [Rhizobacter sp. Root1221]
MRPSIEVEIEFSILADGIRAVVPLANGSYRPHVRVGPVGAYMGVCLVGGGELALGRRCVATFSLMYAGVDYSSLQPGVEFDILEGARVVGSGIVKRSSAETQGAMT